MATTEITRLTDKEFFLTCVDTSLDGLSELAYFAESGDFAAARHAFAEYVRANPECRADLTSIGKALAPCRRKSSRRRRIVTMAE